MRQQKLFHRTLRDVPAEAETASHRLMLRAGLIRQLAAGIYTYLPIGLQALQRIEAIIREELNRSGAQELLLPALHPAELWRESGRWDVYGPELMRLKDRHEREFALGATHEEVVTALMADEITSYKQLPVTVFQIQTKFRDERRPRFGLLRGREFLMKDAYSFDVSKEGLQASYRSMYDAYHRIFARCGLNFRAVEADSGAMGGTDTHEFIALAGIGEDTIVHCSACPYAANVELHAAGAGDACPRCGAPLETAKGIEIGHVFQLGTRYSEQLGAVFADDAGSSVPIMMGCYGIGISRALAAAIEQRHDDDGIVWPWELAPYELHLITVQSADAAQTELSERLYRELLAQGFRVLWDDRPERPGVKFADADLLGFPLQIRIGRQAAHGIAECKHRLSGAITELSVDKLPDWIGTMKRQSNQL
ncbi:proline--tRNA ligase [Gordoniibacillus kamchatkensis]|uniref:Proline--tRNA ligase n=1 Tax=Gordoniibacillus kamchatkensis TaxID=1590651 RepID=A0ABR5AG78_9BACL|nr:proline--tRNA ligase [Paenibacillus sp. VKM B-2647]KIL40046.1 proline--tRNA ligase [Paenibacillus sp. VKM B-2647]